MLLPIENPSPDPHEISLKGVDLSNPALGDQEDNPIPKFSIRSYVFNSRSKDINTNWPFSQKNLNLCLKHGVKDLLPPFKDLDCVKSQSGERDIVESSSKWKEKIVNTNGEPSKLSKDPIFSSHDNVENIDFRSKQLKATTKKNLSQEVVTEDIESPHLDFPKKDEISKPPSMKKCKLSVKVSPSTGLEPSSKENAASNNSITLNEPLSSKVCPVCRTFSSSSNTTLNAHIDGCLSMESPIDSNPKSRVIKYRIKPRKTRLMVDIYATAPHCTLEELDRRNGRILNENLSSPMKENVVDCGETEDKRQRASFEEKVEEGVVYIDESGTKLRILNKIDDTSSILSKSKVNPWLVKDWKGGKGSKMFSSSNKKKHNAHKHHKYIKLAAQRDKTCSYKTRSASRVLGDQREGLAAEENQRKDENTDKDITQSFKAHDSEAVPKWASAKRTGIFKRRFESDESISLDQYTEKSCSQKVRYCYESSNLSPHNGKMMENSSKFIEKTSPGDRIFSSKGTKISSLRERMLPVVKLSSSQDKSSKKNLFSVKEAAKNQFRAEEEEEKGKVSVKRSSILKIRKNKSPVLTSRTTDVQCASEFLGQESENLEICASNQVGVDLRGFDCAEPEGGNIVIGQCSGVDDDEKRMSLTKSFDQEFYMMGNMDIDTETDPIYANGNYFSVDDDPITIPGPPGSFLPSPGRTSSDEEDQQLNSSVTTSQVPSSDDMVDRYSSISPKSTNSTVSNSILARPDSESTEKFRSEPFVTRDEIKFKSAISDENTLGFSDGKLCCCSLKEGVSVNYQRESQLLRRRVMSSFVVEKEKELSDYSNERPKSSNLMPQVNNNIHGNFRNLESENAVVGPVSVKVPIRVPNYGDPDSPSPSSPNPVLRLMGKNLMVVNNDENLSEKVKPVYTGLSDRAVHRTNPFYGYSNKGIDWEQQQEYKPCFSSSNDDVIYRSRNSPFSPLRHKTEKVEIKNSGSESIAKQMKEVIVIDGVAPDGMNVIGTNTNGVSNSMVDYRNSRYVNPSSYFSSYRGSHMIPNNSSSSQMPLPPPSNLDQNKWNCVLDQGSNNVLSNHSRSSFYYSRNQS